MRNAVPTRHRLTRHAPLWLWLALTSGCANPQSSENLSRYAFERPEMGVPFHVVLYAADREVAREAALAALNRVRELNDIFSNYEYDSEISILNRSAGSGQRFTVSAELWEVLIAAQTLAARSEGAFDVTVGPYANLWRRARRRGEMPRPDLMARAQAAVGYDKLDLDPRTRTVELPLENMRIDLGGIAKGYALDQALRVLESRGIRRALVEGGGDIVVGDAPPQRPGWRAELSALDSANTSAKTFLLLQNQAIATSGDTAQHVVIHGVRYSHIVDPRTGLGLTNQSQVTVIAPDGLTADSLATTLSVLNPEAALEFVREMPGVDAAVARQKAEEIEWRQTPGFAAYRVSE
jgi:thiamine biosynthesis lipoprotein